MTRPTPNFSVVTSAPTGGRDFFSSTYVSYSYRRQHFSRPQRPEIFVGSSVAFCNFAIFIDTGGIS